MNIDYSQLQDTQYIDQYLESFRVMRSHSSPLADINLSTEIFSFLHTPKHRQHQWIQFELLNGRTSGVIGKQEWSLRGMYRPDTLVAFARLSAGGHVGELEKHEDILKRWTCLVDACFASACAFDQIQVVEYLVTHCSAIPDSMSLMHLVFANAKKTLEWLCKHNHIPERQYSSVDGFLYAYDRPELSYIWSDYMQHHQDKDPFVYGIDGVWRWVNFYK